MLELLKLISVIEKKKMMTGVAAMTQYQQLTFTERYKK